MTATVAMRNLSGVSGDNPINETEAMEEDYYTDDDDSSVGIVPKVPYLCTIYIVLILGLIGNTLVFVLMQHPWYRHMSYSVYLRFLAVCDTLVLFLNGSEDIMDHQFHVNDFFIIETCIPWDFFRIVSRHASPWLIVALTLDRFVAIVIPLKRSAFCSMKVAIAISSGIILLVTAESAVILAHLKSIEEEDTIFCYPEGSSAFNVYDNIRNLFLQSTFPCFLILVFNIVTIVAIKRGHKFRQSFKEGDRNNKKPAMDKVTISLIAVSLMAFVTLVPIAILEVLELLWGREHENTLEEAQAMNLTEDDIPEPDYLQLTHDVWPLLNLINLVNFAQNFYVLIITSERYRKALRSYRCVNCLCSCIDDTDTPRSSSTLEVRVSSSTSKQSELSL